MLRGPASEQTGFGPASSTDRIASIDALRGIALLGVLAINLVMEFRVSIFEQFLIVARPSSSIDRAVEAVLMSAVELKAFALFSLLFGVGLAMQFERLSANPRRTRLLVRRLIVLLGFGLLHLCLIWNGDILTEYALAGLIVLPFLFGPRWLLAGGALAFLGLYLVIQAAPPEGLFPDSTSILRDIAEANHIYATGGFAEVLAFRLGEIRLIFPLHVFVFARTIGLFLLGAFIWRTGILRKPHQTLLFWTAGCSIGLGAVFILLNARGHFAGGSIGMLASPAGTILLALGYGAAIIALANSANGRAFVIWAAPVGRMAFTNYLAQSVIFGWMFYGYGLGLFGQLGAAEALAIGLAVYGAQVFFSAWWLGRYRFGPIEWLWRTLMYGVRQPMSLSPLTPSI